MQCIGVPYFLLVRVGLKPIPCEYHGPDVQMFLPFSI